MIPSVSAVWMPRVLILALGLAPLFVTADIVKTALLSKSRPNSIPSARLREALATLRKSSEPIVVAPNSVSTDIFLALGEQAGSAETALVDPDGYARVIEIARGNARFAQTASWKSLEERNLGSYVVRILANPFPRVNRQDLVANFHQGEILVSYGPAGSSGSPCQWLSGAELALPLTTQIPWSSKDRFVCRPEPEGFVGVVVAQDHKGTARRCLWVWPLTNAIRLTWPSASAGGSLHISGGIPRGFEAIDSSVELRVFSQNKVLGERRFSNARGFLDFDVPTPSRAEGVGELTIEVSQKNEATSPVCLEASIR